MKDHDMSTKMAVAYYDSISVKPYVRPFLKPGEPERGLPEIQSILSLNQDMESSVIQSSACKTKLLGGGYEPLQFVHFSDIHGVLDEWNRMVEYINHYEKYISFALHTGDYCGDSQDQYMDFYAEGTPCVRPVLNCVGNHDTIAGENWESQPKKKAWEKLFNHTENWGAVFMEGDFSMTYYRDFPDSNIRLIVLDLYYDGATQAAWLSDVLKDALEKGYYVMTAMHELIAPMTRGVDVTFQSLRDYGADGGSESRKAFEREIVRFMAKGGNYICNLAGHYHTDRFGYTESGILNVAVECASDWAGWCEGWRVRGTRTYDCFNVVCVDVNLGLLKLVRIGDNTDLYLRSKRVFCYDFVNKKVISNG